MSQDVFLPGFGFTAFRSFSGPDVERVGPLSKVHLLAGSNNAGKSNVLRVAQHLLPIAPAGGVPELGQEDAPFGSDPRELPFRVAVAYRLSEDDRSWLSDSFASHPDLLAELLELLLAAGVEDDQGMLWLEYVSTRDGAGGFSVFGPSTYQSATLVQALSAVRNAQVHDFQQMAHLLANTFREGDYAQNASIVLRAFHHRLERTHPLPPVATVSAFRRIDPGHNDPIQDGHDGPGLIQRLAELQSPSRFDASEDERRFAAITRFVATLFDDPDARIQAANNGKTIFITQNGQRLPLENYGTGMHEIVILAAAATVLSGHLVCIEEPEIHLHPTLQRRLVAYLGEETDNQYLIATHSAHMLDTARASISAVSMSDGRTQVAPAITPRDVANLNAELGLRASDLVQANAIVWVEGPSDRTYLRHWLSLVDDQLIEGEHFSIMFYGGALLSELSPEDLSVDEFVSLPRINRNFSIVIDSDRQSADAKINATKARVRDEFEQERVRGVVWITQGYTIENYVPPALLADAVAAVHPNANYAATGDPFENPLGPDRFIDRKSGADKAAIAREVVEHWPANTTWPLDLEVRIRTLATTLREVNDLPTSA